MWARVWRDHIAGSRCFFSRSNHLLNVFQQQRIIRALKPRENLRERKHWTKKSQERFLRTEGARRRREHKQRCTQLSTQSVAQCKQMMIKQGTHTLQQRQQQGTHKAHKEQCTQLSSAHSQWHSVQQMRTNR
jgi:hypothetical protein